MRLAFAAAGGELGTRGAGDGAIEFCFGGRKGNIPPPSENWLFRRPRTGMCVCIRLSLLFIVFWPVLWSKNDSFISDRLLCCFLRALRSRSSFSVSIVCAATRFSSAYFFFSRMSRACLVCLYSFTTRTKRIKRTSFISRPALVPAREARPARATYVASPVTESPALSPVTSSMRK